MKLKLNELPVAIIGAGPIGLAMAAKLALKKIPFVLLDKSLHVAASLNDWGHVSVFTPWEMNIDLDAKVLLSKHEWIAPEPAGIATGQEIRNRYLLPLSELPEIKPHTHLGAEVTRVVRLGLDKTSIAGRSETPFQVTWYDTIAKNEQTLIARSIIDASGVWNSPNPMGVDGFPVTGESENSDVITYGIPDVLGLDREKYLGKKVLVVGSGHSAMASIFGLDELNNVDSKGATFWLMRRGKILDNLNANSNDPLPARHALNTALPDVISKSSTTVFAPSSVSAIEQTENGLNVSILTKGNLDIINVDRIIVSTGFRPDQGFASELQYQLDPMWEAPVGLVDLINPHLHTCGSVPEHGYHELKHIEPGYFIVGHKSYGRAPTFLMKTGYAQLNSIVAFLNNDEIPVHNNKIEQCATSKDCANV